MVKVKITLTEEQYLTLLSALDTSCISNRTHALDSSNPDFWINEAQKISDLTRFLYNNTEYISET